MEYKISKKHFKTFIECCKIWQDTLNLRGWRIEFTHEEDAENYATVAWHNPGRIAVINLSKTSDTPITDIFLNENAFHEMMELKLAKVRSWCTDHMAANMYDEVEAEMHEIIRTLEGMI